MNLLKQLKKMGGYGSALLRADVQSTSSDDCSSSYIEQAPPHPAGRTATDALQKGSHSPDHQDYRQKKRTQAMSCSETIETGRCKLQRRAGPISEEKLQVASSPDGQAAAQLEAVKTQLQQISVENTKLKLELAHANNSTVALHCLRSNTETRLKKLLQEASSALLQERITNKARLSLCNKSFASSLSTVRENARKPCETCDRLQKGLIWPEGSSHSESELDFPSVIRHRFDRSKLSKSSISSTENAKAGEIQKSISSSKSQKRESECMDAQDEPDVEAAPSKRLKLAASETCAQVRSSHQAACSSRNDSGKGKRYCTRSVTFQRQQQNDEKPFSNNRSPRANTDGREGRFSRRSRGVRGPCYLNRASQLQEDLGMIFDHHVPNHWLEDHQRIMGRIFPAGVEASRGILNSTNIFEDSG